MASKSGNDTAFKKFLNENKSLKYMLPLLAILVIVVIIIYSSSFGKNNKSASSYQNPNQSVLPGEENHIDSNQPQVEVLPQIIRSDSEVKAEVNKNPFESPMKLVGIIYSDIRSTAIVEWENYSYIVQFNDKIGDSDWTVTGIEKDSITLMSDGNSIVLALSD